MSGHEIIGAFDRVNNMMIAQRKVPLGMNIGIPISAIGEISMLKEVRHSNVANLLDVVTREDAIFLIYEHYEECLSDKVHMPIPTDKIMYQLLKALYSCHSHRYMHRDVCPSNILLNSNFDLKLTGFAFGRQILALQPLTQNTHSLLYRAPEELLGASSYSYPIDVWSAGCVFAEILSGKPLFYGNDRLNLLRNICQVRGTPSEDTWNGVGLLPNFNAISRERTHPIDFSEVICDIGLHEKDLLEKMLEMDPSKRISAKAALQHPYFQSLLN